MVQEELCMKQKIIRICGVVARMTNVRIPKSVMMTKMKRPRNPAKKFACNEVKQNYTRIQNLNVLDFKRKR